VAKKVVAAEGERAGVVLKVVGDAGPEVTWTYGATTTKIPGTTLMGTMTTRGGAQRSAGHASRKSAVEANTRRTTLSSRTLTKTTLPLLLPMQGTVMTALVAAHAGRRAQGKKRKKTCWINWMPKSVSKKPTGKDDGTKRRMPQKKRVEAEKRPERWPWTSKARMTKENSGSDGLAGHVSGRLSRDSTRRTNE
jgi:hypothetical protein